VALIYVNNDYGKGGRESLMKALEPLGVKVTADISTDQNQVDFSAPVLKAKQSNADVVFVYTNEEESARALRELRKQGVTKPIVGETTLVGQKVIELAGDAANGAIAHVGLTVDAPMPAMRAFRARFEKEYRYTPDHNGIKGYTGVYILKAAIEKAGKVDRKAIAAGHARPERLGRQGAERHPRRRVRQQRRPRSRELPGRGARRQAGDQGSPAGARQEVKR
jgi:branched-chain amino acid transport system substrate-binding protein